MSLPISRKPRREVMSLTLIDHTFKDEKVERENPGVLFCKKHDGYTPIIFKSDTGPAWKGDKVTRWLSVEGLPLVHDVDTMDQIALVGVEQYLRAVWGEKGFNGLPAKLKEDLSRRVDVTVSVTPIEPDEETTKLLNKVKAKSLLYDMDIEQTANLGKSAPPKKWTEDLMDKAPWILAGVGLCYALQGIGILAGIG